MRVTGGYPFHVQDAVAALKSGRSLADLQPGDMTGVGTRRAWRKLDPEVQRAAIMLAAFTDPPPRERIPGFLSLDTAGWAVVEQRLWDARIFAIEQDQYRSLVPRNAPTVPVAGDHDRAAAARRG